DAGTEPSDTMHVAAPHEAVDHELLKLQWHRRECRHRHREAAQKQLLTTRDPPDRSVEIEHGVGSVARGAHDLTRLRLRPTSRTGGHRSGHSTGVRSWELDGMRSPPRRDVPLG